MVDPTDWHDEFGPRTPAVASLAIESGHLRVGFDLGGETASDVTVAVYRDGSKRSQPLNTRKTTEGGDAKPETPASRTRSTRRPGG